MIYFEAREEMNEVKLSLPDKERSKELVKPLSLDKFAELPTELKKSGLAHPKEFKALVLAGKDSSPRYFVFDTYSLWDLLCAVDEKYEKNVSNKEYVYHNPIGWLIDAIEPHLPLNPKVIAKLKKNIEEAKKTGLVPFKKIKADLGLA